MLVIPFFTIENKDNFKIANITQKDTIAYNKSDIYGYVSREFKPEYDVETLKAITVILQSNYSAKENSLQKPENTYMDKNDFYKKYKNKSDKYYKRIKQAVDDVFNQTIVYRNKEIYIPYRDVLNENCDNSEYTYIKNCATPWDCLNKKYKNTL